jgi:hypothetical protein
MAMLNNQMVVDSDNPQYRADKVFEESSGIMKKWFLKRYNYVYFSTIIRYIPLIIRYNQQETI